MQPLRAIYKSSMDINNRSTRDTWHRAYFPTLFLRQERHPAVNHFDGRFCILRQVDVNSLEQAEKEQLLFRHI